jgi:hypothetical protein
MVVSNEGFIYKWELTDNFKQLGDGIIDRSCDFKSAIFLNDPRDEMRILTVGAET